MRDIALTLPLPIPASMGSDHPAGTWLGLAHIPPPPRPLPPPPARLVRHTPPLGKVTVFLGLAFRCEVAVAGGVGEGDEYFQQVVAVT